MMYIPGFMGPKLLVYLLCEVVWFDMIKTLMQKVKLISKPKAFWSCTLCCFLLACWNSSCVSDKIYFITNMKSSHGFYSSPMVWTNCQQDSQVWLTLWLKNKTAMSQLTCGIRAYVSVLIIREFKTHAQLTLWCADMHLYLFIQSTYPSVQ